MHCAIISKPMRHLEFNKGSITLCLLKSTLRTRSKNCGGKIANLPDNIRYDGIEYVRMPALQRRCKVCQKNTRCMCLKYYVHLYSDNGIPYDLKCTILMNDIFITKNKLQGPFTLYF